MIRAGYIPLATVMAAHPEVARWLKHVRKPHLYEWVKRSVYSNPVPGAQVVGVFVVSVEQMKARLRGDKTAGLIVQDFFVHHPNGERRAVLYSGWKGSRQLRTFCRLYSGPQGVGYGCGPDGLPKDHHYEDASKVGVREGRFRASLNDAIRRADRAARRG